MKIITKVGLGFLGFGLLLFLLLMVTVLNAVGGSANPPLPSPLGEIVYFIVRLGIFWYLFAIAGAVLIAVGAFQKKT